MCDLGARETVIVSLLQNHYVQVYSNVYSIPGIYQLLQSQLALA
jgi:hypothetical protein